MSVDEVSEVVEELVVRAAAVDIAKASAMVCTRVPDESRPGRVQRTWTVGADTAAILELGGHLRCLGVERVVMEATGTYWKPYLYLLESCGLQCWPVNARDVKNVPGRPKTDKLDSVWLCKLNERGMLRASFVPPLEIRELRDLTPAPGRCSSANAPGTSNARRRCWRTRRSNCPRSSPTCSANPVG